MKEIKRIHRSAGIGLLTSRINIEGPLVKDKSSFIFGARTTYANWLLNLLPNEYKKSKAAFNDANLNITHEIDKQNSIYFTGYMSNDQFNLNNDTSYHYGNRNISLKWKHVFNNKWYAIAKQVDMMAITMIYQAKEIHTLLINSSFDINQYYLKTHVNYFANAKHTIEFGMNHLLYKLHPGKYAALGNQSFIKPDEMQAEQAVESAYLSDKFTVSPDLSLEGAVRYTIFNSLGAQTVNNYASGVPKTENNILGTVPFNKGQFIKTYHGPEIRVTARYVINETLSVKAGYNTQKQFIHVLSNTGAIAPTDIWKLRP